MVAYSSYYPGTSVILARASEGRVHHDCVQISISAGIITTYSTTVIRNFGYSPPQAALLNMPGGIVTIIATVISGYFAGIQSKRWLWISILAMHAVLGSALMCFLPMKLKIGHLVGVYLVNAVGSLPT